ncbi:Antibiotic biosynthesis monooxygenase [Pseudovibrio axinellae]|uniref:Antibiotic biosynthesis monooxygenase n=1 Tax=Pseudovibrio axinellae TaxID=989403 RepID=A0A165YKG0_9HYPH|nr:antibiotic biosynthesis monooxygenase [Pseudovibrio axinellae]KZL18920.1 Antibiotic biosynthesis monooxygenase [Pseudovibrio axinellae]SEP87699.1 Heme-degrading monooxygenase HmoA [Pseudovibrio axinellae]
MIAVIFEVEPYADHKASYLDVAASIKPELEKIQGFISVERFQSLTNPEKILSLSFFEDEEAVKRWRTQEKHQAAQQLGRNEYFQKYRIRVASVLRDYGLDNS